VNEKMAINNLTVKETEGGITVPEGLYQAKVKEIKENTGEFGPYVKLAFDITEGEFNGTTKTLVASLKMTRNKSGKNSKLYDAAKAILKEEPKTGDSLDLNNLIGKTCQILIINGKLLDGVQYQDISKVLPD